MKVGAKQENSRIRTVEDLIRRYDLDAIEFIRRATMNNEQGLNRVNASLEGFVNAVMSNLEDLQSQIDGSITTHFYKGYPTLENIPAKEWKTDDAKNVHLGDLYYDQDTGYGYRFALTDGIYGWLKITDNDVVEALALANAAQDTADGKRRVFVDTPSPPYDKGDLWIKDQELYICLYSKKEGEFQSGDFGVATKYTDDTRANEIAENLEKNYTTTVDMNLAIEKSSAGIIATVSADYVTKTELSNKITAVTSQITDVSLKADGISTRVTEQEASVTGLEGRITTVETSHTQLSNKFSWIVKSGTSASNFTLTDRMAKLTTESLVIKNSSGTVTVISGGKMDIDKIFAQDITATGKITGATLIGSQIEGANIILETKEDEVARLKVKNTTSGTWCELSPGALRWYDKNGRMEVNLFGVMGCMALNMYNDDGLEYSTQLTPLGIGTGNVNCDAVVTGKMICNGEATISGKVTTEGDIYSGGHVIMPNGKYLSTYDSNGDRRTIAGLTEANVYQFGVGGVANTIQIGNATYTSDIQIRSADTTITGIFRTGGHIFIPNGKTIYTYDSAGTARTLITLNSSNVYGIARGGMANTVNLGSGYTTAMNIYGDLLKLNADRAQIYSTGRIDFIPNGASDTNDYAISVTVYASDSSMITLRPTVSGNAYLGNASYRWMTLFTHSSVNTSSDRRLKEDIRELDEKYIRMVDLLAPKSFYSILDAYGSRRRRIGYVAQEVEAAAIAVGLTLEECNFIHKDWVERADYVGYEYSLNYDDLAVIVHGKVQKHIVPLLSEHEKRILELERQLAVANALIAQVQSQQLGA